MINKKRSLYLVIVLVLLLASILLTKPIENNFSISSLSNPVNKTYVSDEMSFLKTFYYIRGGMDYYHSFKLARYNLHRSDNLSSDISVWRMPTIFYFWDLFAGNGSDILTLFIFLSFLCLFSVYFIIKKISNKYFALLSSLFLLPYFIDTLRYKTAFLFTEWWALFFYIFALAFLTYKKNFTAALFFSLTVMTRELFLIPVILLFTVQIIKREDFKVFLVPFLSFGLLLLFHQHNINQILGGTGVGLKLSERLHGYSIRDLQGMFSFSMREYVISNLKTHFFVIFAGLLYLLTSLFLKPKLEHIYLFISAGWGVVILPFIAVTDNDYWGIMFVPILLFSAPLFLSLIPKVKPLLLKKSGSP